MEVIILAGGLGTRLSNTIGDKPKCLAPIAGRPFLQYLFQYLEEQCCKKVILALGYKYTQVLEWLSNTQWNIKIETIIEKEPLGTGGAISLALSKCCNKDVIIINGDTMFRVDLKAMLHEHQGNSKAAATIALKYMTQFDRYGAITLSTGKKILMFKEKEFYESGYINGGVYIVNKASLLSKSLPSKYSFEREYLEKQVAQSSIYGYISQAYFIDIGIPSDFNKAQTDFLNFI